MKEVNHHTLDLPQVKELWNRTDIEVWDDDPDDGKPPHVTLYIDDTSSRIVDLLPNEARALAALLINAADWQEMRANRKNEK